MDADEIKKMVSMSEVLGRYGIVHRRVMASCPKHKDKTPSMKIYKDGFKCFSCGWSGDIFDFVRFMDNLSFKEAFMLLGGTYESDKQKKEEIRKKIELAEIKRKKKAEREAEMRRKQDMNNNYITALRNGLECFPVFSDEWCACQNELAYQLYRHDILNEPEVIP